MKEQQRELEPKLEKISNSLPIEELQEMAENINKTVFIDSAGMEQKDKLETFFVRMVDHLFNDTEISLKTEYLNEDEQFCGTKLDFMIKKCGFPFGKTFLFNWEKKRVSLGRKSRQEIIMSLWEKQQERKRQEELEFKKSMNM